MTTLTTSRTTTARPSARRRVGLVASGVLACALPTVWGVAALVQLLTGTEADHRFHQVTGQGLMLSAVWLGALIPLLVAGWRGVRPAVAPALLHLGVVAGAVVAAALAPGNGGAVVAALTAATGALVWAALPARPGWTGSRLDPVIAPLALATAALYAPFVVSESALQRGMVDEHADMSHYFDMAWLSVALVVMAVGAALVPAARRLAVWALLGTAAVGLSRYAFTPDVTWSLTATVLGLGGAAAVAARLARRPE